MQKNMNILFPYVFKLIKECGIIDSDRVEDHFAFLSMIAKRMWVDGVVTKDVSDILDSLFLYLSNFDKDHKIYTTWMIRRSKATSRGETISLLYDKCFSRAEVNKDANILDVGSREGLGIKMLKDRGYKNVRGIELCKEAVEKCTDFQMDIGDIHSSPYSESTFDLIIFKDTLEHCYDQEKVLRELYRILKPNGYVFIGFPTAIAFSWTNCRRITVESFFKWIHDIGFISIWTEVVERSGINPLYNGSTTGVLQKLI